MIDLIPSLVDGAIVLNLQGSCRSHFHSCEKCTSFTFFLHNWLRITELAYLVFDLQDEKHICPSFLEGLILIRKRIKIPFLFAGVMNRPRNLLQQYNYGETYPFFIVPEDAIRALRMQHPGLTEKAPEVPILFDYPLSNLFHASSDDGMPISLERQIQQNSRGIEKQLAF